EPPRRTDGRPPLGGGPALRCPRQRPRHDPPPRSRAPGGCPSRRARVLGRCGLRRAGYLPCVRDPCDEPAQPLRRQQARRRALRVLLPGRVPASLRGAPLRERLRAASGSPRRGGGGRDLHRQDAPRRAGHGERGWPADPGLRLRRRRGTGEPPGARAGRHRPGERRHRRRDRRQHARPSPPRGDGERLRDPPRSDQAGRAAAERRRCAAGGRTARLAARGRPPRRPPANGRVLPDARRGGVSTIAETPLDTACIRNFSIIAHIDHGKSTLADRLLERTGAVSAREMAEQFLDDMELERERGITIKARSVRLAYRARDGQDYVLNLIDTPGHVDFTYEVSRSLAACEGAILVVDASQGVQAQTLANVYLALDHDLAVVPVINKIDLPSAEPERVRRQIEEIIGLDASHAILTSAKEGIGTDDVLEAVVRDIPPPAGDPDAPATALIFDSWFDPYHGAVVLVRVFDGQLAKGRRIRMMATGKEFLVTRVGVLAPGAVEVAALGPGEVGVLMAAIKE